ncbi:MAG: sensor histidine kinase [Myxococcales bacterium]
MTTKRRIAMRLAVLVALSGLLPIVLLAVIALQIVRSRGENASREALQAVAEQAAARIATYIAQQREMLRALAMAVGGEPDAVRRLADVSLDAPSLGKVRLVTPETPPAQLPPALKPDQVSKALAGSEVVSGTYLADLAPAMDACVPSGKPQRAVCSTLDLLELQRQVQRIHIGDSGYALAFDRTGRLLAAGAGTLRAAVLSGEPVAESAGALALTSGASAPHRIRSNAGGEVIAGWAYLPDLGWTIAVEQPVDEALRGARSALLWLGVGGLAMLILSISLGAQQALRMLAALELEERFRTAGQIAAGITHDLGHRLAILKQTRELAETNDAAYLPRIRESLTAEVETMQRFVSDFADLTREARLADFMPLELNAFAESVKRSAEPYAAQAGVSVDLTTAPGELWVLGDRYMLERAALNLARNAIEASPQGSRVALKVTADGARGALRVGDQGTGIAAARLPTLFDSFTSTKRTGAHVGMGLPNVRRIAVAHGGNVSVKSEQGKGSEFTITLPLASERDTERKGKGNVQGEG